MNEYDYTSNVYERCRTTPDGWDCETVSRYLLSHTNSVATDNSDREHVTTHMRKNLKNWKHGVVINHVDLSGLKLSVDTKDDYDRVVAAYNSIQDKIEIAEQMFGERNVHRL